MIIDLPPRLLLPEQLTLGQYLLMLGDRLPRTVEMLGHGIGRHAPHRDQSQYRPPGRVRYRLKYISSRLHDIIM